MNWKDIIERAAWTAVQAFTGTVSAVALSDAITGTDLSGLQAIGLAGVGAAASAVLSLMKTIAQERLGRFDTRA